MDRRAPAQFNPNETIWDEFGAIKGLRRKLAGLIYRFPDSGLFGLKRLRTHIVICGYQRSGTTLLLMMMEYALPNARRFGREKSAWRAATFEWRNHEVLISKMPVDIFRLHCLRNFYNNRRAKLRTIIMIRDPRDVLTSRHPKTGPEGYFQDSDQWRDMHVYVERYRNDPDVLLLRYEDLVADPDSVQEKVDAFTGEKSVCRYVDAHKDDRPDFDTHTLNGVRPVDKGGVGRWRRPEHRDRMEFILRELPQLPQVLIDLGYESDTSWIEQWRKETASPIEAVAL
jgi:hypothetical protein